MSKYGSVIRQARQGEAQKESLAKNASATQTDETRKLVNQKTGKPENQKTRKPEVKVAEVNLSIKVSKARRRHWVTEARRQDTTLTAAIIQALQNRFGEPDEELS